VALEGVAWSCRSARTDREPSGAVSVVGLRRASWSESGLKAKSGVLLKRASVSKLRLFCFGLRNRASKSFRQSVSASDPESESLEEQRLPLGLRHGRSTGPSLNRSNRGERPRGALLRGSTSRARSVKQPGFWRQEAAALLGNLGLTSRGARSRASNRLHPARGGHFIEQQGRGHRGIQAGGGRRAAECESAGRNACG